MADASRTQPASGVSMPLRRRLVLGLAGVVSFALVVVGLATFLLLQRWMLGQVDDNLTAIRIDVLTPTSAEGRDPSGSPLDEAVRAWGQQGATVYVVDSTGAARILRITYRGSGSGTVSDADVAVLASIPTGPRSDPSTVTLSQTGEARAIAISDSTGARLIAAVPLARVRAVTRTVLLLQVIALAVALLIVGLASSWWIRRSLRPLEEVARTAAAVAALPLYRGAVDIPARAPPADPSTEVGQVVTAVNTMLDHVESSLRERERTEQQLRRFVSDAGHELRTPLAAVRGYAELVRRAGPDHPEQALASASRIEIAATRMGLLVDDLLLLASLDEGRPMASEDVRVDDVVRAAVTEAEAAFPDHDWRRGSITAGAYVRGDGERLHQVVTNLLANAAVHTPPGTTVNVRVATTPDSVIIVVRDNGPGFDGDVLPRATERFARGDSSRARSTGGTGLGLSIVRAIVEGHGGSLDLSNDRGAVATVRLPLVCTPDVKGPPMPTAGIPDHSGTPAGDGSVLTGT